ncbi:MAG: PhnD/SsuA/transferrin family substrate-binding protein [Melioribacteraceae bacterium]
MELIEDVNMKDARVVLELWTDLLKRNYKEIKKIDVRLFKNPEELVEAVKNKEVDIIYLSGANFVIYEMGKKYGLEPITISKISEKHYFDLFFFTNNKNKINNFKDLKNKTILVQGGKFKTISELWLDLLCLQNGEPDKYRFFRKVEFVDKPMKSVLPVFFGKADFCIINSISYSAITEMNPQVSHALNKLFERKNLVNDLVCVPSYMSKVEKDMIFNASINYENLPNYKQLGKILKSIGSYAYSDSTFAGIKNLWNDYIKIKNK